MRKLIHLFVVLAVALAGVSVAAAKSTSRPVTYSANGTSSYFGDGNLPPGCIRDMSLDNPRNQCFHMRTGLNALDSPKIDVLVLAPASPTAERDLRLLRQSVEMWAGGIERLSKRMGMGWLDGVDFRITADILGGRFSSYSLIDPEIVVLATNPVGGIGIGIDPAAFVGELGIYDAQGVPCHGITNPFDLKTWTKLKGFDAHHGGKTGTYVEDCGGAGGNVCFAVNGAIDPAPGVTEVFSLFDLVSHEVGHCLTVGHVGDGAEGDWGRVPTDDIMSYNEDPVARTKCVSSLDVEGFALRMSRYLDRNRDGKVGPRDRLDANDLPGDGRNPFQVQHPKDHVYASSTGRAEDCPQPDYGLVPGGEVEWGPAAVRTTRPVIRLTQAQRRDGRVRLAGTVRYAPVGKKPTKTTGSVTDATGDATGPFNDLTGLDVRVTRTHVEASLKVARLWPSTLPTSASSYSLIVNGRRFDSLRDGGATLTYDNGSESYVSGMSTWVPASNTVRFRIPRAYLAADRATAPYAVGAMTSVQNARRVVANDDFAPKRDSRLVLAGPPMKKVAQPTAPQGPPTGTKPYTVDFRAPGGNSFEPTASNLGLGSLVSDPDVFSMEVTSPSRVELTLDWADPTSELDLSAQVGAEEITYGSSTKPERIVLAKARGPISIEVNPTLVGPLGTTYTLRAKVTPLGKDSDRDGLTDPGDLCPKQPGPLPSGCPDRDRDGVPDKVDRCPGRYATTARGCPAPASEWVRVSVDGTQVRTVRIDREAGVGRFRLTVPLRAGRGTVRAVWADRTGRLAAATRRFR